MMMLRRRDGWKGIRVKRHVVVWMPTFFILLGLCQVSYASHPLITDDAGTQGKGKFQLEINGGYGQDEDNGLITKTTQISTTLTYGLSDLIDIVIGLPYEHTREESSSVTVGEGISDMSIEMKWRIYEKNGLSFALKPGFTLPMGNYKKGLGAGRVTYQLFFIGTEEIKPWSFHLNLGYIRNENRVDENRNLFHASLASTLDVIKDLQIVGDVGIERNTDRNLNVPDAFILGGLIYSVSEDFDVDLGVKGGLTKPSEDYSFLAGITWRF